jgi:uncharacterized protein (DUF2252 family)
MVRGRRGGSGTVEEPPREPASVARSKRLRTGRELRHRVRRSAQASWEPPTGRPNPIDVLVESDRGRLADLLPIRYGRMAVSPFGFLRGAAVLMARDLADTPTTGLRVQLVGDAHIANFGLFATPEREQVFDANDFDETLPGPWEWDLKRLATSLVLAARANGFSRKVGRAAARTAARAYRRRMLAFAHMRYLDTWYCHLDLAEARREVGTRGLRLLTKELPAARQRTGFHAYPRLVRSERGAARIVDAPPLIDHFRRAGEQAMVRDALRSYRSTLPVERRTLFDRYHLVDVAQKVVGVGSVGTRCAVGLFLADADVREPLFLQVKEALPAAGEPYLGRSPYADHAERVVVGQRMVQEASDIFLGWGRSGSRDFYVRQLRDMKIASDLSALGPNQLAGQAQLCGAALARAHARTGDPAAIAGYAGPGPLLDRAIVAFAEAYAAQTERDHAELKRAIARGRLPVTTVGVRR